MVKGDLLEEAQTQVDSQGEASVAAAIDHATVRRMRTFHSIMLVLSSAGIGASFVLGGHQLVRTLFRVGLVAAIACNVWLMSARTREAMESKRATGLWVVLCITLVPTILYFGMFSAALMIPVVALQFIAVSRTQTTARTVLGLAIIGHLGLAVPIITGWIPDVGLLSVHDLGPTALLIIELLVISFFITAFAIGRWMRSTTREALGELAEARRVIDDQQQALAEIHLDDARANRANVGRWTGQTLGGTWRLGFVLGRGAMGEVYEGTSADGREAAVKLLAGTQLEADDAILARFHREMMVAASLSSPHIVRVYEVSPLTTGLPYIVMERLRGQDLATKLRAELRMELGDVVTMLEQIAGGLEVAHAAGVVHRDLKPRNLFCHDGAWKILDFGVAKVLGSEATLTGAAIVGTPSYMAPEQAAGTTVTHLADIYALGAIAYRCLTGRTPFASKDLAAMIYQVVHEPPPRPHLRPSVPAGVADVLAIAMAKDPDARFRSARELVDALSAASRGKSITRPVPSHPWR